MDACRIRTYRSPDWSWGILFE